MKQTIINLVVGTLLLSCCFVSAYRMGQASIEPIIEPVSDYIWIDEGRFHKDSVITYSPIYNGNDEQLGLWIKVSYEDTHAYIECMDSKGYTWDEWRDSWIMSFKEAVECSN